MAAAGRLALARRIVATDTPVMVQMQQLLRGTTDVLSLAQGVVYWKPPAEALEQIKREIDQPDTSFYGPDDGLPELRAALVKKLATENQLHRSAVMVTAGANQAFVNLVLSLCDAGDRVVMFIPYYFNSYMAFQMTGVTDIVLGPSDPVTLQPDTEWLENILQAAGKPVPKLVSVVNPGNPSGTYIPEEVLKKISALCQKAGSWLVVDNTYEYFMYDGLKHVCIEGEHILNVFSFSKAYGMMGWRIGYIAYPSWVPGLGEQLLKVQDNIPICASIIGQKLALASLSVGPAWVRERVQELAKNRATLLQALAPLGEGAVSGGQGALYFWVRLPPNAQDDVAVVRWLLKQHGVVVIPGSASGGPGCLRISFGGLTPANCVLAAHRLRKGIQELVQHGLVSSSSSITVNDC